jgi:hypothetical protein
MGTITWWNRVEPRPRTDDITTPLQARVRDPLWMLTRQWQLGEFKGIDSGSPAWVELTERIGAMTSWSAPGGVASPIDSSPLEKQLEREAPSADLATGVELGQVLSRLLADAGASDAPFRGAYPVAATPDDPNDPVEAQLRRVCAGRAIDGVAAYEAIKAAATSVPPAPPAVLQAFVAWVESTIGAVGNAGDPATWQPTRLEYAATVNATVTAGSAALDVHPGDDGLVDWAAFDLRATTARPALASRVRTIVPAHVRFKGMPNARFWDFENGTLDFGDIKPDKRDLARLALIEFMLLAANDWFMLPVDMPVGGTYQLDSLIVHDVFGLDTLVQRADREALGPGIWTMFSTTVAGTTATADFFLLPPTAGASLQAGRVVEEVRFARDEMANMVWAIENVLENAAGAPWPQHERDAAIPPLATTNGSSLKYSLESRIPTYWIPFLPESIDATTGSVALALGDVLTSVKQPPVTARGRILHPTAVTAPPYRIPEEEVPRNGVMAQRFAVRSRWTDGSTHVWQMRRVQPGTGEAASALKFDEAESE